MQNATYQSRQSSSAIRLVDLRLSVEEMNAVRQGLTIVLTKDHSQRRGGRAQAR